MYSISQQLPHRYATECKLTDRLQLPIVPLSDGNLRQLIRTHVGYVSLSSSSINTCVAVPIWTTLEIAQHRPTTNDRRPSQARFAEYLTTILRLSYDNAKLTTDLR